LDAVARHLPAVTGPFEACAVTWLVAVPVTALYGAPQVADDLLTRALEAVPKGDPDWPALTPSEQRIAALVGRGLSNPEIAGQLFLSRYTVRSHVSRILAKLGTGTRLEIVRALAEGRLPGPITEPDT